jgi:ubiquinone/menaquinone biosynthesis C-methylase UbiE
MVQRDFSVVTELPGLGITVEQREMMNQRYGLAASLCSGRDVLDVGSGGGQGARFLTKKARSVIGGDYTMSNLIQSKSKGGHVKWVCMDAVEMPFRDASFDTVLLFDVIYWLSDAKRFFDETLRILRRPGTLVIASINPLRLDFHPSQLATYYPTATEVRQWLEERRFSVQDYYSFPVALDSKRDKAVVLIKNAASKVGLIPKTAKRKEWLKRIFLGSLRPAPSEIDPESERTPELLKVNGQDPHIFKYYYSVGTISS